MKKRFLLFLLIMFNLTLSAGNVVLHFQSDKEVKVKLYTPIDGFYNGYTVTDTLNLEPKKAVDYSIKVDEFGFVKFIYLDGKIHYILVFPNDRVGIAYSSGEVIYSGTNATGESYYEQFLNSSDFLSISRNVDAICRKYELDSLSAHSMRSKIETDLKQKYCAIILNAEKKMKFNPKFSSVLCKEIQNIIVGIYLTDLQMVTQRKDTNPNGSGRVMVREIEDVIASFFREHTPDKNTIMKYMSSSIYMNNYYKWIYDKKISTSKEEKGENSTKDISGLPCPEFSMMPFNIRLRNIHDALGAQDLLGMHLYDAKKAIAYVADHYPKSEALKIMKAKYWHYNRGANPKSIFLNEEVNSLKGLSGLKELQGKYIYIDLWASWCVPCRMEFAYKNDVEELLKQYKDVAAVYISVDENEKKWKEAVGLEAMDGYNMRTGRALHKDIEEKVYKGGNVVIPHYLLLDKEGNILENNLPRPSNLQKLKEILDKDLIKTD